LAYATAHRIRMAFYRFISIDADKRDAGIVPAEFGFEKDDRRFFK
jgi:hypothetical protein